MGGQLSCVSCKNRKETNNSSTAKEVTLLSHYIAVLSNMRPEEVDSFQQRRKSNHNRLSLIIHRMPNTVQLLPAGNCTKFYKRVMDGFKREKKLSDVEKVARAIVEINVYLASQVIYPALERYMREVQQKSDEDKQEEDNEEKKEEIKQRFSKLPHNESKTSSLALGTIDDLSTLTKFNRLFLIRRTVHAPQKPKATFINFSSKTTQQNERVEHLRKDSETERRSLYVLRSFSFYDS